MTAGSARGGSEAWTVGVEEEFLLVDPLSFELTPSVERMLAADVDDDIDPAPEMSACVVETDTPICATAFEVQNALIDARNGLARRAELAGCRIVASATHPFSTDAQPVTQRERYLDVQRDYGWVATETVTCGMHIHIGVSDPELAVQIANVLRGTVPQLLALSANSPFWKGEDTGLASVRARLVGLFPRSGVPPVFEDWDSYRQTLERLTRGGAVADHRDVWWAVRLHPTWGTIEVRTCDVQLEAAHAAAIAALVQGTCARIADELELGCMIPDATGVLIEENLWSAARHGLDGISIDLDSGRAVPMRYAVQELIRAAEPYIRELGSAVLLPTLHALARKGGAHAQRSLYQLTGSLPSVVAMLASRTAATSEPALLVAAGSRHGT